MQTSTIRGTSSFVNERLAGTSGWGGALIGSNALKAAWGFEIKQVGPFSPTYRRVQEGAAYSKTPSLVRTLKPGSLVLSEREGSDPGLLFGVRESLP
jgi:hypothetical protein